RPVWIRTAEVFLSHPEVVQTILVISPDDHAWFREKFAANLAFLNIEVVDGGRERADSVQNALARVSPQADYVAVHDAARPLITRAGIDRVFAEAVRTKAAIPGVPISSTIKRVDQGQIQETVDRTGLWGAQTPQVFERQLLLDVFARRGDFNATDEAQLVERLGHPVSMVEGSPFNLKITTQEDLRIATALLNLLPKEHGLGGIPPKGE